MRLSRALAVLSLVSASASLSTGGQNNNQRTSPPDRTKSSPFPSEKVSSSTTRRAPYSSDVFAEVETNNSPTRKNNKRLQRPPLVDSALLRFLSKQKKLKDESNISDTDVFTGPYSLNENATHQSNGKPTFVLSDSAMGRYSSQQKTDEGENKRKQQTLRQSRQFGSTKMEDELIAQASPSPQSVKFVDSIDSWMGQFNRNRVAQLLLSTGDGVDEEMAKTAGESVQRHVLARTARRRVREFLRERDSMWEEGLNGRGAKLNNDERTSSNALKQPEYGFADVVELLIESGLTAKDTAEILAHTPSIALMMPRRTENQYAHGALAGETLEETLNRALSGLLCGRLKLRRYDARKVLRNCPGLLTKRGSQSALHVVEAMSRLGVSTSSMARDKNALPTLLSRSPAALFRLIAFLSSDAIRMPLNKIGPLIRRTECTELLNAVAPVLRSGDSTTDTTSDELLPSAGQTMMEQRRRSVDAIYEQMSSTAWTLRNEIGTHDLGKVIAAYPSVLLLDAEEQILPAANFLMEELGIWEDDLARVLQLYPALLGMPMPKFKEVIEFILEQGVDNNNLASIFRSFPALLTLDVEKDMVPVVEFLRSIGITNTGRFISRLPPILGYSVERELTPKWEFIRDIYTYESFELSKFPAFFSYPLERVIKARFEYLRDVKRLPVPLIAPDLVLRYGDRDFATKVAGDKDGGAAFTSYLKHRQQSFPKSGRRNRRGTKKPAKSNLTH